MVHDVYLKITGRWCAFDDCMKRCAEVFVWCILTNFDVSLYVSEGKVLIKSKNVNSYIHDQQRKTAELKRMK